MLYRRHVAMLSLLLFMALLMSACGPVAVGPIRPYPLAPPDAAPGKVLMSQLAEAWSSDAPELIDATLAPDFVLHCAECPDIADIPQYKEWVAFVRDFAPDFRTTFTDLIAEGEWVVARGTSDATIVELGDPIHPIYGQLQIARVVDGQIAELWLVSDEVAVNKIFGEIPNPEQRVEFLWGDDSTLQGATGTRAENTELVRQWVEGDDSARESLAADEFMFHSTLYPEQHTYPDRTQIMDELRTAFPDLSITLEEPLIVEGEKVAARFTIKGTHTGPYFDLEASGKALEWPGIAVYRVLDGTIAEEWMLWSGYYVYSQIRGW